MFKSNKIYNKIHRIPFKFIPIMVMAFFSINVLGLVLPLTMKKIYGSIIVSRSVESLQMILSLALIALAFEAIMRRFRESSSRWIAAKYEFQLSNHLIDILLAGFIDESNENYISNMEKFKSISRLGSFYSTAYYQLLIDLPFMGIFLFLIYLYGGLLILIPISLSVIYVLIMFVLSNRYFKTKSNYIETNDVMVSKLIETLEKIHFVKASGIEESQILNHKRTLDQVSRLEYISQKHKIIPNIISKKLSQMSLFLILIAGGYMVGQGKLSFGQITACAMLGGRAIAPVIGLMRYYQQTRDIKLLKQRIDQMASIKPQYDVDVPSFPQDIYGAVELIELEYVDIQSNHKKHISTLINAGDFVVINPTDFPSYRRVFKQLTGEFKINNGKVLIDNLDINEWNMNNLKGKIEYLKENVNIFKGSVLENITYFDKGEIQNAFHAAALTGLDDLVSKMPEGFATELDSHMLNYLSAAFLQRLNLTRALLETPRIMIFDRIDESMDNETLEMFIWILEKLKGNTTIIAVSWHEDILSLGDYNLDTSNLHSQVI